MKLANLEHLLRASGDTRIGMRQNSQKSGMIGEVPEIVRCHVVAFDTDNADFAVSST